MRQWGGPQLGGVIQRRVVVLLAVERRRRPVVCRHGPGQAAAGASAVPCSRASQLAYSPQNPKTPKPQNPLMDIHMNYEKYPNICMNSA